MEARSFWLLLVLSLLHAADSVRLRLAPKTGRYLIASFPLLRQINYVRLPDPTWRPLVVSGLEKPQHITVDAARRRLFVYDEADTNVVWYHFRVLPSGRLITDGHRHLVLASTIVRSFTVDNTGALFVAGVWNPPEPEMPFQGIFKLSAEALDASVSDGLLMKPFAIWTKNNTMALNAPGSPRLNEPSAVAVDPIHVFWGNGEVADAATGAVIRGAVNPPLKQPEESLAVLDAGMEGVTVMAATPSDVYYVMAGKIYGVHKDTAGQSCGENAASCGVEVGPQRLNTTLDIKAMIFDGEGTMYLSDKKTDAIYSFASGSLNKHYLTKVLDATSPFGLALFSELSSSSAFGLRRSSAAASKLLALLAAAAAVAVGTSLVGGEGW